MKSLVSSSDENASDQESNMDKYAFYSKDKVYELKNSGYMKKKIISAIKKSLKTNNNKHSLSLNDVSVSEEKEIGNGCRQSLNIRIALDDKLYFSSGDAGVAPINIETFKLNDSTPETKCCSHCSGSKEVKREDWPSYFSCVKCDRKEKRKWYHENCKEKCCTETSIYCDNCLRFKLTSIDHNFEVLDNKFAKYMYVVTCPNGGGISLHMDYERIMHFTEDEQKVIAKEFLKEAFKEDKKGFAQFTIAIVHNGASYMPDLLKLLAELHPTLPVKTTKLKCNTETEVMDLGTYYTKVKETYSNGTYAFNPLNEIQAASVKNDECGAYLPELLSLLEKSAFLTLVLPWSDMTTKRFKSPHESDDGPIFWCRPGEQIVSLDRNSKRNRWNADEIESFLKERQQNLKYFCEKRYIVEELKKYRRSYSSREVLFEDRTRPHADQVWGNNFECTAAVGVIQAIHPDEVPEHNRACKEIVVFHAKHFEMLEALLHIDVTAAPKQQCAEWLDDAKLNMIRQMNIRYSKMHLYDNDIYFIPRKIVHQFKTISATLSVAWHTRLIEYYLEPDPPPVSESAEGSEEALSTAAVKGEQLSDNDDASSSCSSDSLPPPVATPKKSKTATPKKKRKLSCTRSTASTDTEATPRKKKKPRSRSGTPQKRAPVTPKKRQQKTPKKVLILDEADDEDVKPAPQELQKASSVPEVMSSPASVSTPQAKEFSSSSRSSSPVAGKSKKKKSRSRSPSLAKKHDDSEHPRESNSSSRSSSPVVDKSIKKRSKSRSPSPAKKLDNDQPKESNSSRSSSPVAADTSIKNKSRSQSPPPVKKRSSDETGNGEPSKKKKKRKSRSRSRSRKHSSSTSVVDKERKTDSSEGGKSNGKKKKDRSKSRSPKKSNKSKDAVGDTVSSSKSDICGTHSKSSKKSSSSSSSKKPDEQHSKSSTSEKERKKHRSDKDHRSRSDSSPKRRDSDKTTPGKSSEPSPSSSAASKEPNTVEVESHQKSPPMVETTTTERCPTPTIDLPTAIDADAPAETNSETNPVIVEEALATSSSTTSFPPTETATENALPPSPIQEPIPEEKPIRTDEPPRCVKGPMTPPSSPPRAAEVKQEPNSPSVPENGPVPVDYEIPIKSESRDDVTNPVSTTIKEEPGALTADEVKNTSTSVSDATTKTVSDKVAKKVSAGADSTTRTGKDHRKKEKLWDTPLFMPQDCDKYEWTKRSSAGPAVSNRVSTKNGDKIVKQKTLNSLQQHKVDDGKSNSGSTAPSKPSRSRSRSPPPWIKKKEKKSDDSSKLVDSDEVKKASSVSGDKRGNVAVVDKDKPSSTSSSSDKHRSEKEKKSSDHKRNKDTSGKKDADRPEARSSTTSDKKKSSSHSSYTKDAGGKSSSTSSSSKDHSHEKRKRSRSPQPEKSHRDKHSSSSSKKHKKHRSKSRDRNEPTSEKNKTSGGSTSVSNAAPIMASSTETLSLKSAEDAELAANYKLMIPRVQIVDIGAKYKNGSMQSSPKASDDTEQAPAAEDVTESDSVAIASVDQNKSSEMSDQSHIEVDETTCTTECDNIQQNE